MSQLFFGACVGATYRTRTGCVALVVDVLILAACRFVQRFFPGSHVSGISLDAVKVLSTNSLLCVLEWKPEKAVV